MHKFLLNTSKKTLSAFVALVLAGALVSCGSTKPTTEASMEETTVAEETTAAEESTEAVADDAMGAKKKVTVTTTFLQDMVRQIAGPDLYDIQLIIPAGEDPHTYTALPDDLEKVSTADLVLAHGLHFEGKMQEALHAANAVEISKDFPADKIGQMEEDGEMITDPHFWFDLDLYKSAVTAASEALVNLDADHADDLKARTADYLKQLDDLDAFIKERISEIPEASRKLITPHDAFNYFSRAYGMEVRAPQGVSTATEVSAKDVEDTVDFIVNNKVKSIFAESTTDPKRMEKLLDLAAQKGWTVKLVQGEGKELFSDSLAPDGEPGDTFIDMYKHNIDLIVDNLK